jgi:hypothetical protein
MAKKDKSPEQPTEEKAIATKAPEETALAAPAIDRLTTAVDKLPVALSEGIKELAMIINPQQEGYGELDEVRYRPPVVKVKQPVTTAAPKAAQNGDIFSQDTGEVFSKPLPFVPIYPFENRARFQPGAMKPDCRSEDCKTSIYGDDCSKCPDRPWKDNKQQKCNNSFNIIAASPDFSKLYHLQFSKTSMKAGTSVVRQARNAGKKPWQRVYNLDTEEVKGGQGIYYVFDTSFSGDETDPQLFDTGRALHDVLGEQRMKMREELAQRIAEGKTAVDALDDDIAAPEDVSSAKSSFDDL